MHSRETLSTLTQATAARQSSHFSSIATLTNVEHDFDNDHSDDNDSRRVSLDSHGFYRLLFYSFISTRSIRLHIYLIIYLLRYSPI
jgi:hypothetical protein